MVHLCMYTFEHSIWKLLILLMLTSLFTLLVHLNQLCTPSPPFTMYPLSLLHPLPLYRKTVATRCVWLKRVTWKVGLHMSYTVIFSILHIYRIWFQLCLLTCITIYMYLCKVFNCFLENPSARFQFITPYTYSYKEAVFRGLGSPHLQCAESKVEGTGSCAFCIL